LNDHSNKGTNIQNEEGRTFIEEVRRAQIMLCAIDTLAELGYGKSSLAQIAKRCKISTSLILYHFRDKDDLVRNTLQYVTSKWLQHVEQEVQQGKTAREKLRLYIEANLRYMLGNLKHFAALIEIVFNARNDEGMLLYQADEDDPAEKMLADLLQEGQTNGEFRSFDILNMVIAIRGAIDHFLGRSVELPVVDGERYIADTVALFDMATRNNERNDAASGGTRELTTDSD
jgi:TetR/AcrR family transcriptional repressor of bet genes